MTTKPSCYHNHSTKLEDAKTPYAEVWFCSDCREYHDGYGIPMPILESLK